MKKKLPVLAQEFLLNILLLEDNVSPTKAQLKHLLDWAEQTDAGTVDKLPSKYTGENEVWYAGPANLPALIESENLGLSCASEIFSDYSIRNGLYSIKITSGEVSLDYKMAFEVVESVAKWYFIPGEDLGTLWVMTDQNNIFEFKTWMAICNASQGLQEFYEI